MGALSRTEQAFNDSIEKEAAEMRKHREKADRLD